MKHAAERSPPTQHTQNRPYPSPPAARYLESLPADKRGPLWGIPFTVKDNIDVANVPTTCSCPDFAYTPEKSAKTVQVVLDAGGVFLGKTNLDQFACGLVGTRTPYGIPPNSFDDRWETFCTTINLAHAWPPPLQIRNTLHPLLPTLPLPPPRIHARFTPGGSSSGSAVAVADAMCTFALGTDTAGSGRVPAGQNGVVGIKPTLGRFSTQGVVPACYSLDCVSIFALCAADGAEIAKVMENVDIGDPTYRIPNPVNLTKVYKPKSGFRFAVPQPEFLDFSGPGGATVQRGVCGWMAASA